MDTSADLARQAEEATCAMAGQVKRPPVGKLISYSLRP